MCISIAEYAGWLLRAEEEKTRAESKVHHELANQRADEPRKATVLEEQMVEKSCRRRTRRILSRRIDPTQRL